MRLPSVSYWPPWHGQPKPDGLTGIQVTVFRYCVASLRFTSAFGWTGQPRWAQWFEMNVKLGSLPRKPLLRMKAVRRETKPASGFEMNVVIRNLPSG